MRAQILDLWQIRDYMGIAGLRWFNIAKLRRLGVPTLILANADPLAVMMPYETFMAVQRLYNEALEVTRSADPSGQQEER